MKSRIVLDTNVFVSALMNPSSTPGKLFKQITMSRTYELVVSEAILEEIERVLFYPKVRKYIHGTNDDLKHWIQAISITAHVVTPREHNQVIILDDPDDDKFILAALDGKAKVIVTGDTHLLKLKTYQGVSITTPAQFLSTARKW